MMKNRNRRTMTRRVRVFPFLSVLDSQQAERDDEIASDL